MTMWKLFFQLSARRSLAPSLTHHTNLRRRPDPGMGIANKFAKWPKPFKLEKVRQLAKLGVSTNKSTSTLTWNDLQSILSIDIDECYFGFYLIRLVEHKPQTPPLLSPLP